MCCIDAGWNISKLYFSLKKKKAGFEKKKLKVEHFRQT